MAAVNLRVASFNIRNGRAFDGWNSWPFRRSSTAGAIAALDADVAGLQEVFGFQLRWFLRRLPGYTAHGQSRNRWFGGERCPVMVRTSRLRLVYVLTRWYADEPDRPGGRLPGASFPRIGVIAELEVVEGGARFQLANTHLDARLAANRLRSAELLARWLDPRLPRIVVGDMNAAPEDPLFGVLAAAGLRQALPATAGGTNHNFTGRTDGRRIDHILVSDEWEVVEARVQTGVAGQKLPSDHWPVVAAVRLP